MAARSASQDAKRLAKKKKTEQGESDDDEEEDNQEEEDEASPSNSEVEKAARQNKRPLICADNCRKKRRPSGNWRRELPN